MHVSGDKKSSELIDMDVHTGEHPRVGAVDVVPFVPIHNMSCQGLCPDGRTIGRAGGARTENPSISLRRSGPKSRKEESGKCEEGSMRV